MSLLEYGKAKEEGSLKWRGFLLLKNLNRNKDKKRNRRYNKQNYGEAGRGKKFQQIAGANRQ